MTRDDEVTSARLMVLEYERIKDEQRTRIGFRDNLLYVTLAAMATVIAVSVSARDMAYLLLLPPVSLILGWTYLANDEKISAIGRYIRGELAPRLAAKAGDGSVIFGWETTHRSDARRSSRKFLQVGVDLLTFCGSPLAAIVGFWATGPTSAGLVVVSLAEMAAVVFLVAQIVLYADLRQDMPPE
ncbi:MAG TPA: hypothetical protein VGD53_28155 [Actinoallomurus sp.]